MQSNQIKSNPSGPSNVDKHCFHCLSTSTKWFESQNVFLLLFLSRSRLRNNLLHTWFSNSSSSTFALVSTVVRPDLRFVFFWWPFWPFFRSVRFFFAFVRWWRKVCRIRHHPALRPTGVHNWLCGKWFVCGNAFASITQTTFVLPAAITNTITFFASRHLFSV